jgi:hypothetical protein
MPSSRSVSRWTWTRQRRRLCRLLVLASVPVLLPARASHGQLFKTLHYEDHPKWFTWRVRWSGHIVFEGEHEPDGWAEWHPKVEAKPTHAVRDGQIVLFLRLGFIGVHEIGPHDPAEKCPEKKPCDLWPNPNAGSFWLGGDIGNPKDLRDLPFTRRYEPVPAVFHPDGSDKPQVKHPEIAGDQDSYGLRYHKYKGHVRNPAGEFEETVFYDFNFYGSHCGGAGAQAQSVGAQAEADDEVCVIPPPPTIAPEPSTVALLGGGLAGVGVVFGGRRRRGRAR